MDFNWRKRDGLFDITLGAIVSSGCLLEKLDNVALLFISARAK